MAPGSCSELPFALELPVEVFWKAGETGKERRIAGIISTEHQDIEKEVVKQSGLDLRPFLHGGWINDNHSRDTAGVVGYPLKVERTVHDGKPATYMEGYLLQDYKPADKIWELAEALQKTDRRLGFSIEGKVRRRSGNDGKVIAEAVVRNVAVTNCPVNPKTGLDVLEKSLALMASGDSCDGCNRCSCVHKALSAGQSVSNPGASPGEGFPLRTEHLEARPKVTTYSAVNEGKKRKKKRKKKRRLNKSEAVALVGRRFPGATPELAERIIQHARQGVK
ncbi:MAG: hypothetical protein KJN79_00605 [Gammaproteobacteria bacterium]|nr:hypothetical protein [Gammaproteobacteria bacterium]